MAPPASDLGRSTGDAVFTSDDDIVAQTSDESEKSIVVASDAAISSGVQSVSCLCDLERITMWNNVNQLDGSTWGEPIGQRIKGTPALLACVMAETTRLLLHEYLSKGTFWIAAEPHNVLEVCRRKGICGNALVRRVLHRISNQHGKSCQRDHGDEMHRGEATCALVACAVAVEAMHRRLYERKYGQGTFLLEAAEPHKQLLHECRSKGIWTPAKGAYVGHVLKMIEKVGVPTTNNGQPLPPPRPEKYTVAELSKGEVAELLDDNGPCVGTLWTCPWYYYFTATSHNDLLVYRGCGRSKDDREESERLYPGEVSSHAVVCIGYRFYDDQMHLLVLDNHTNFGPRRWVDVEEFDELHTVSTEAPPHSNGGALTENERGPIYQENAQATAIQAAADKEKAEALAAQAAAEMEKVKIEKKKMKYLNELLRTDTSSYTEAQKARHKKMLDG
ncbi:hypothetical protein ACP70R_042120 [Stipagrostis hirtigluma subsp. patula]